MNREGWGISTLETWTGRKEGMGVVREGYLIEGFGGI